MPVDDHTGTRNFLDGIFMKVDVRNDVTSVSIPLVSLREARAQAPQVSQQNAVEEVGMLFSQQVESSSKVQSRRNLRTDTPVLKVQGIQQLNELYEQLGHPGQVSLGQLTRQVRQELMSRPSVESLLALAGDDPARTYVVLQHVTAQAQAQGRVPDAVQAQAFQEQMQVRFLRQIQAGVNIARALKTANGDASLCQAVRTLYYSSVVMKQSLVSITQALLGLLGEEGVDTGLNMMGRALADDIAAYRPSVPTDKLRTLLLGLQACGQLGSILHSCRQFIERSPAREPAGELTGVALLQRLLGYASIGTDPGEIQDLSRELGEEGLSGQLVSLNQVYSLVQQLPPAVWGDPQSRQATLQSLLALMGEHTQAEGIAQLWPGLSRPIR